LTWTALPDGQRPNLKEGERRSQQAAPVFGVWAVRKSIITTGGKVSRLWASYDEGETWGVTDLPVLQGVESAGAFSTLFWKSKTGVVVGGDYKNDTQTGHHVYLTMDKGKTWTLPIRPTRGLRECVEFLGDDTLIAIGRKEQILPMTGK